jgi:hypothetical protein
VATVSTPGECRGSEDFAHGLGAAAALVAEDWLAVELDFELPHPAASRPASRATASTRQRRFNVVDGLSDELKLVDQHS